jgi:hypothetical protein
MRLFQLLVVLASLLPLCTFDSAGTKTDDCKRCACAQSENYGDHACYNGSCIHCGASC